MSPWHARAEQSVSAVTDRVSPRSNSRSEKEVGELNSSLNNLRSKFESLEVSKRQLQVECDELSNSARAEKVKWVFLAQTRPSICS